MGCRAKSRQKGRIQPWRKIRHGRRRARRALCGVPGSNGEARRGEARRGFLARRWPSVATPPGPRARPPSADLLARRAAPKPPGGANGRRGEARPLSVSVSVSARRGRRGLSCCRRPSKRASERAGERSTAWPVPSRPVPSRPVPSRRGDGGPLGRRPGRAGRPGSGRGCPRAFAAGRGLRQRPAGGDGLGGEGLPARPRPLPPHLLGGPGLPEAHPRRRPDLRGLPAELRRAASRRARRGGAQVGGGQGAMAPLLPAVRRGGGGLQLRDPPAAGLPPRLCGGEHHPGHQDPILGH